MLIIENYGIGDESNDDDDGDDENDDYIIRVNVQFLLQTSIFLL